MFSSSPKANPLGGCSWVGFQAWTKATRFFCSARFYVEDDLVNAFPTIMSQVFKRAGLKTPFLDDYVTKREELFQILGSPALTRDALKSLFLVSLHGGNYRCETRCIVPFLEQFQSELRTCTKFLLAAPEYADIKAKHDNSPLGSAVGLVSQLKRKQNHSSRELLLICSMAICEKSVFWT